MALYNPSAFQNADQRIRRDMAKVYCGSARGKFIASSYHGLLFNATMRNDTINQ